MYQFPQDYCVPKQTAYGGGGGSDFNWFFSGGCQSTTLKDGTQVQSYFMISRITTWVAKHRMVGIRIWLSNSPDGYSDSDPNAFYGATGGTEKSYTFKPGERLVSLKVYKSKYNDKTYCGGVEFTTTLDNHYKNTNPSGGDHVDMEVGYGACVGIYGKSGEAIDCLGFWMIQKPLLIRLSNVTYGEAPPSPVKNVLDSRRFSNDSDSTESVSYSNTYTVSTTEDWTLTTSKGTSMEVTVGVSAEVYSVNASSETSYGWTMTKEETNGTSYSTTNEYSVDLNFELEPGETDTITVFNYTGGYALYYDGYGLLTLPGNLSFGYCLSGSSTGSSGSEVFYKLTELPV
jgi:hypothetical protein